MNNEFEQGRIEFKEENYEGALNYFDSICEGHEDYRLAVPYKISCLIKLERYREALSILNPLLEENPSDELLLFDKVTCHIFLDEDEKAYETLEAVDLLLESDDKEKLVLMAKFYNMLNDYKKAIEYAGKALKIDGNYREALFEKSFAAINLDDFDMIGEVSDRLLEISGNDIISLTPVFLLKLFSKDYLGCCNMIDGFGNVSGETLQLFKSVLYNKLCEDLNAQLLLTQMMDLSVDDALKIMLDFKENDKSFGEIFGVHYFIV